MKIKDQVTSLLSSMAPGVAWKELASCSVREALFWV